MYSDVATRGYHRIPSVACPLTAHGSHLTIHNNSCLQLTAFLPVVLASAPMKSFKATSNGSLQSSTHHVMWCIPVENQRPMSHEQLREFRERSVSARKIP